MIFIIEEKDIIFNDITCLYFYTSWMPFHKKMISMISKIEEKYKINFFCIDCDSFRGLVNRYQVSSVPEILIYINNKEEKRLNGLMLFSALKKVFADIFISKEKYNV